MNILASHADRAVINVLAVSEIVEFLGVTADIVSAVNERPFATKFEIVFLCSGRILCLRHPTTLCRTIPVADALSAISQSYLLTKEIIQRVR